MPLAELVLLVIAAALALEPFARAQTRKLLDGLDGARADFSEVHVTLFPLRYRITHLKVREVPPKTKEPVFYADELAVNMKWDRLVTGHLVGSVQGPRGRQTNFPTGIAPAGYTENPQQSLGPSRSIASSCYRALRWKRNRRETCRFRNRSQVPCW